MELFQAFYLGLIAQEAAPAPQGGMNSLFGILLMIIVFFALVIWPQSRKAKKHAEFINSLKKGDAVVTQGGLYGRVSGIAEKVVTLEIASKVFIRVDRQSIAGLDPFAGASSTEGNAG